MARYCLGLAWLATICTGCGRIGYDAASTVDSGPDAHMDGGAPIDAPVDTDARDAMPDVLPDATGGDAGPCVPTAEECNGRDDDCDGTVDEAGAVPL